MHRQAPKAPSFGILKQTPPGRNRPARLSPGRFHTAWPLLRHSFDARYSLRAINGPHGGVLGQLPKTMKPTPFTSDAEPSPPRGGPLVTVGLASWPLRFRMCRRADTVPAATGWLGATVSNGDQARRCRD